MRITTLALAVLLVLGGAAMAQPPKMMDDSPAPFPGHPPMGMKMMHGCDDDDDAPMRCLDDIDLTDEQEAKLEKMALDHHRKRLERRAVMVDLQTRLKLAITAEKFNQKEIDDLAAKIGKFHQEAVSLKVGHLREVRAILNDEQRIEFDQNLLKCGPGKGMGKGRFKKMGRGMGCGPADCD